MDDLFVVYRYLTNNRHMTDDQNPYTIAHRTLDSYLEIEREMAYYANVIRTTGGLDWDEAEQLTERLLAGFETGLNTYHGDVLRAAQSFMQKYISSGDIGELIEACKHEQARMQREEEQASQDDDELGDLDEHPF